MSFDLSNSEGLKKFDEFLANAAKQLKATTLSEFPNVAKWFESTKTETAATEAPAAKAVAEEEDDDDVDLFGSDDSDVDEEAEKIKQQRIKEYEAKKAAKGPKPAAKSIVTLDVKAWDDETDMDELSENVLKIEMDGLTWGGKQLIPVGFGMKKLQVNCVVEDDKVSLDELVELIQEDEDHVQSVDVAAMQKV